MNRRESLAALATLPVGGPLMTVTENDVEYEPPKQRPREEHVGKFFWHKYPVSHSCRLVRILMRDGELACRPEDSIPSGAAEYVWKVSNISGDFYGPISTPQRVRHEYLRWTRTVPEYPGAYWVKFTWGHKLIWITDIVNVQLDSLCIDSDGMNLSVSGGRVLETALMCKYPVKPGGIPITHEMFEDSIWAGPILPPAEPLEQPT